jgi:hypothetical protein
MNTELALPPRGCDISRFPSEHGTAQQLSSLFHSPARFDCAEKNLNIFADIIYPSTPTLSLRRAPVFRETFNQRASETTRKIDDKLDW